MTSTKQGTPRIAWPVTVEEEKRALTGLRDVFLVGSNSTPEWRDWIATVRDVPTAREIEQALNSQPQLLEACRAALDFLENGVAATKLPDGLCEQVEAAIKAAERGSDAS